MFGKREIEGLPANGERTTVVIPTGSIGNDQPLEVIEERWKSPDLRTVLWSKTSDPRWGETTYQLTKITRGKSNATTDAALSCRWRNWLKATARISRHSKPAWQNSIRQLSGQNMFPAVLLALLAGTALLLFYRYTSDATKRRIAYACAALLLFCLVYSKGQHAQMRPTQTAPFDAFSPKVATRWDDKYLYVESNGIPDHPLMVGIKTW